MKLGEIVHSYRAEHGLTMQEFAEKSGLSKGLNFLNMAGLIQDETSH